MRISDWSSDVCSSDLFLISIFDKAPLVSIVFEVVSAISTVGPPRDLTPHLSTASQTVLIVLMYAGRLGPLTLMYSLATRRHRRIRYPETERSEARTAGEEGVRTCRSRGEPYHNKKKK